MPISKRRKRRLLAARQRREKLKSRPPTNARDRETPGTSTASQEATSVPERGTGSDLPVCKKSRFGWSHLYSSLFQVSNTTDKLITNSSEARARRVIILKFLVSYRF